MTAEIRMGERKAHRGTKQVCGAHRTVKRFKSDGTRTGSHCGFDLKRVNWPNNAQAEGLLPLPPLVQRS